MSTKRTPPARRKEGPPTANPGPAKPSRPLPNAASSSPSASPLSLKGVPVKSRPVIWTASFIIITAVGAWVGASLKTDTEVRQEAQRRKEEPVEAKLERLRTYRQGLERRKTDLEVKLLEIKERRKHRMEDEKGG